MSALDRWVKAEPREIDFDLKKMKIENGKDSLTEAFLQVLRNCSRFRELVSNQQYFDFLHANFKNQKALQPIVAFFNLIYSSYTKDGEASSVEFSKILESIRKDHPELKDATKVNDIQLTLLSISSSFRYLQYMMDNTRTHMRTFEEVLSEVISQDSELISRLSTLSAIVNALYQDLAKAQNSTMDVEGVASKLKILKENQELAISLCHSQTKALALYKELNIFITQGNFDDEESLLFNELLNTFSKQLLDLYGDSYLSPNLINAINIDMLRDECRMERFDLQNQVNFGYINVKFQYLSFTKTISCNLMGYMANNSSKNEESELQCLHSRITYTCKLTVSTKDFRQKIDTLRLPKIKNYLLKIMEIDPDMDIINDYDVIAYHQVKHEASKTNYYKFVSIEDRITAVMSGDISSYFNIVFLNEKRLCVPSALKIFYTTKFSRGTIMNDPGSMLYISLDNDEQLSFFIEHILKAHQLAEGIREDTKTLTDKLIKKLVFYLPSTVESEDEILKWKKWSKELKLDRKRPLFDVYEELVKLSGCNVQEYPGAHLYLSCFLDSDSADLALNTRQFDKAGFDKLDKKKSDTVFLNTGLTDIFDYVLTNYRKTLSGVEEPGMSSLARGPTPPNDENAIWNFFDKYPARLFLPTYLIVNAFDVRKLLELGDDLDFDYIEKKINDDQEPLSKRYNLMAIICQKKKAKSTDPLVYYPCIRVPDAKKLDAKVFKGYIGEKELQAPIYKFDKEMVHFLVFERQIIQFK